MGDFVVFVAQALAAFGLWLDSISPVPWPLLMAALLPAYASALSAWVWWMRGSVWPVLCEYPVTTRRRPCRNRVPGEWSRCHLHRRRWTRLTDSHAVNDSLRRWQTVTSKGKVVDRGDIVGRGFVRLRSGGSTLLYRRGFARPPSDVIRFLPRWWQELVQHGNALRERFGKLRRAPESWRQILLGRSPVAVSGVADRLVIVIHATRVTLVSAGLGLLLVALAVVMRPPVSNYINYAAAVCFMLTGGSLREGVWRAEPAWLRLAVRDLREWALPFFLFSVAGGWLLGLGQAAPPSPT